GSALPLRPGDGAEPPPGPALECAQHRRGLAEAKVAAPPDQVDGQLLDDLLEAFAAGAPCQVLDLRLEAVDGLRRDAAPRLRSVREAEAQELAGARFGDRALGPVDLQLEPFGQEPLDPIHHPFARLLAAHIDVAVVGVTDEAMAAL